MHQLIDADGCPVQGRPFIRIFRLWRQWLLIFIPILVMLAVALLILFGSSVPVTRMAAADGVLDLSGWSRKDLMTLEGEWIYQEGLADGQSAAAGQAVNPPRAVWIPHLFPANPAYGNSPYGAATYRLKLTGLDPARVYAMQLLNEASACRLTVNGQEIMRSGTVAADPAGHQPAMHEQIACFPADARGEAAIVLEISNFSYNYGGFWKEPVFGEAEPLVQYVRRVEASQLFFFAGLTILGLFFLGLFSINRDLKALFHFSSICLLMAVRILLTNQRLLYDFVSGMPWNIGTRIEFLTGYLLLPAFGMFLHSLDLVRRRPLERRIFQGLALAAVVLMLTAPNRVYAGLLPYYMHLCVISIVYFLWMILSGLHRHRFNAIVLLISLTALVPTLLLDFYGSLTYDLMPFGVFFMLATFSIVVIKDLFELRRKHDQLEAEIIVDPLTRLHNRLYLNRVISAGLPLHKHQRLFILFIDVDQFKSINDNYGHKVGDGVLIEAARRIRACFRESDIVCRYAGDEFIAFARLDGNRADIRPITERIRKRFLEPIRVDQEVLPVRLSIGVSEYHPNDDLEKVIRASDRAMYEAKAIGRAGLEPGGTVLMAAELG